MVNVVIYTRISRPDKKEAKGHFRAESTPTERQAKEVREYFEKQGDTIVEVVEEELTAASMKENEIDLNQYLAKRPKLNSIISKVRAGKPEFEVLAVWRHDRLARDALFQESLIRLLNGFKIRVFSLTSSNETLARRVQGIVDQEEIDVIRKRTRSALKAKVLDGRVASGVPFGYVSSRITHRMLIHPEKSKIIYQAFMDYDGGSNLKEVADKHFKGKLWRAKDVLTNSCYMGRYTWKEVVVEAHHKPIISREVFDRVLEKVLIENPPRLKRGRPPKHVRHLL